MMRRDHSGMKIFRGYILPELNDALTCACILGAALIVNPHIFNWSATVWLAVISPVAFPAFFQFLVWGTEFKPSISRTHEKQMEECIAHLLEFLDERPESDSAQYETPKQEIPKPPVPTPTFIVLLPTQTNVSTGIARSLHNRGSNRSRARRRV